MSDWQNDIIKYKKGELSPKEMHALEKKALSDPLLADALEGIETISSENFASDVADLSQKILGQKKTILFTPLRIAAGVILVAASIFIFYQLTPKRETIALQTKKTDSIVFTPKVEEQKPEEKSDAKKEAIAIAKNKGEESKALREEKIKERDQAQLAQATKPKTENLPVVEESKGAPKQEQEVKADDQAPVVAMEPNQPIVNQDAQQTERASAKMKRAAVSKSSEVVSGAGLAGRTQTISKPISGKVISAEDGLPLPGVNVVVEGTTQGTVTDVNGNFSVQTSGENQRLVFSFIGLQTQQVNIDGKDKVDVELKSDVSQLSEVVVTGMGIARKDDEEPIIHLATPVGGTKAYNKYLDTQVRYPEEALKYKIKGKVKVEFSVLADGSLDDYKVVKSLGYGCDEEVIRLVKEGPKWNPTTENGKPVESTVRVGVKFDPAKAKR